MDGSPKFLFPRSADSIAVFSLLYFNGLDMYPIFSQQVLGDVIESLAGAIFVDSGYNKEVVFQSIRPLLEPLVTPDTLKLHPVRELNELCQVQHFEKRKAVSSRINGTPSVTVEVEAHGLTFKHTSSAADKKTAKKLASKEVLKALKDRFNI